MTNRVQNGDSELSRSGPVWSAVKGIAEFDLDSFPGGPTPFDERATPSSFSWQDRDVLRWVEDQRPHETCVAFSVCFCMETRRKIGGQPISKLDPEMFHRCVLGLAFSQANDDLQRTLNLMETTGAPHAGSGFSPGDRCQDFRPTFSKSIGVRQMSTAELTKEVIANYSPVVVLMTAEPRLTEVSDYSIFRDQDGEKTFSHAMLLVGYDDNDQCWIVQNSFGPNWGQQGFGRIAYGSASILADDLHRCYLAA